MANSFAEPLTNINLEQDLYWEMWTLFEYRSIYFYIPEDHPTRILNAEEFYLQIPLPMKCGSNMSLTAYIIKVKLYTIEC